MSKQEKLDEDLKAKEDEIIILGEILDGLKVSAQDQQQNHQRVANSVQSVDACIHDLLVFIDNELLNLKTSDNENLLTDLIGIISNIKSYAITTSKKAHRAQASQVGFFEGLNSVITSLTGRKVGIQARIADLQKLSEESDEDGNIDPRAPGDRPVSEKTKREYKQIVTDSE